MNSKQYKAMVDYFKMFSPFDDEQEREDDAQEAVSAIDEILRENADE
ncbi:hypothetical protein [Companilactobacillus musae]|nr:hypothetical protein [Companilactobacillus musae]